MAADVHNAPRANRVLILAAAVMAVTNTLAPTPYPSLRLITCGGDYDKRSHEYLGNTIVYAHLTAEKAGRMAVRE